MQILEAVSLAAAEIRRNSVTCSEHDPKNEKELTWKARVDGRGQDTVKCSGKNLYGNMTKGNRRSVHPQLGLGVVPEKQSAAHWAKVDSKELTPDYFPLQAHHLIPKSFLPKQAICVFVCKSFSQSKNWKWKLIGDVCYSNDHANNGYAMPYASPLKDWKKAKSDDQRARVAMNVMDRTGVQLHQGSHAATLKPRKLRERGGQVGLCSVRPKKSGEADEFEEALIHNELGYNNPLKKWLHAASLRIFGHQVHCSKCIVKRETNDKFGEVLHLRPIADTARVIDQVSMIAKVFIENGLIFTCAYSAVHALMSDRRSSRELGVLSETAKASIRTALKFKGM